eukprot:c27375_g1_i1 orf=294-458(-)
MMELLVIVSSGWATMRLKLAFSYKVNLGMFLDSSSYNHAYFVISLPIKFILRSI